MTLTLCNDLEFWTASAPTSLQSKIVEDWYQSEKELQELESEDPIAPIEEWANIYTRLPRGDQFCPLAQIEAKKRTLVGRDRIFGWPREHEDPWGMVTCAVNWGGCIWTESGASKSMRFAATVDGERLEGTWNAPHEMSQRPKKVGPEENVIRLTGGRDISLVYNRRRPTVIEFHAGGILQTCTYLNDPRNPFLYMIPVLIYAVTVGKVPLLKRMVEWEAYCIFGLRGEPDFRSDLSKTESAAVCLVAQACSRYVWQQIDSNRYGGHS